VTGAGVGEGRDARLTELPLYLPVSPARPVVTARRAPALAERWRQFDRRLDRLVADRKPADRQPARRGAAPGPAGSGYRAATAQCTEITFRRAVEVPFERSAAAMVEWWRESGHDGVLDIGCGRLAGPPGAEPAGGACRMEVRLRRGPLWPPVLADLELFPWLGTFGTQLTLCPRRTVHPGRHYFASGHQLLDAIVAVLERPAGSGPPPG
jgi:hypothetical protein